MFPTSALDVRLLNVQPDVEHLADLKSDPKCGKGIVSALWIQTQRSLSSERGRGIMTVTTNKVKSVDLTQGFQHGAVTITMGVSAQCGHHHSV